jgi:hypothetical protein
MAPLRETALACRGLVNGRVDVRLIKRVVPAQPGKLRPNFRRRGLSGTDIGRRDWLPPMFGPAPIHQPAARDDLTTHGLSASPLIRGLDRIIHVDGAPGVIRGCGNGAVSLARIRLGVSGLRGRKGGRGNNSHKYELQVSAHIRSCRQISAKA